MKTNAYNKEEHIEGYIGSDKEIVDKSDVQKAYEKGNEGNKVNSFGKEPDLMIKGDSTARDGLDNSGTQGKDSLSDDTYNAVDKNPPIEHAESRTGSSSKDFQTDTSKEMKQRDEDDVFKYRDLNIYNYCKYLFK